MNGSIRGLEILDKEIGSGEGGVVGTMNGNSLGDRDDSTVGAEEGRTVGRKEGGVVEGRRVGFEVVGFAVGAAEGRLDGMRVGALDEVGFAEGRVVAVGVLEGVEEGRGVGRKDGRAVEGFAEGLRVVGVRDGMRLGIFDSERVGKEVEGFTVVIRDFVGTKEGFFDGVFVTVEVVAAVEGLATNPLGLRQSPELKPSCWQVFNVVPKQNAPGSQHCEESTH